MRKNKVIRINGVRTVVPITKDHDRPLLPPGKTFRRKTDYNRRSEKQNTRREIEREGQR